MLENLKRDSKARAHFIITPAVRAVVECAADRKFAKPEYYGGALAFQKLTEEQSWLLQSKAKAPPLRLRITKVRLRVSKSCVAMR